MRESISLERRLAGHIPPASGRPIGRGAFAGAHQRGLRGRLERNLDQAVEIFELDRLLYDIEVDALGAWLRNLMAFDAYCARRDAASGR